MKNFILYASLVLLSLAACDEESLRTSFHNRGTGQGRSIYVSDDKPSGREGSDTTVYTLGVEYPWSYDWQRDTAYGNVDFRFIVFAGQKRLREIDGGPKYNLSPDPDMNRLFEGHLYSDYSIDGKTILLKDGKELFRYEGEEMMCGIMVKDGCLYTLGQSRSGKGFSFRKDGEEILSRSGGRVIGDLLTCQYPTGALYMDGETMCFGFAESDDGKWKYYTVKDGKTESIETSSSVMEMLDIRVIDGSTHMVYKTSVSGERPVYCNPDGKTVQLGKDSYYSKSTGICFGRIFYSGEKIYIQEKHMISSDGICESRLWRSDGSYLNSGMRIERYWVDGDQFAYLCLRDNGQLFCIGTSNGNNYVSDNSRISGTSCALLKGDCFYVAITPERTELSPYLWENGKQLALQINGYLIGLEVEF